MLHTLEKNNQISDRARGVAFFISAAIIIIEGIILLFYFFSDAITITFILRGIVIFVLAFLVLGYNLDNRIGFIARIPNRIKIIKYTSVVIGVVCIFWIGSLIDILHAKDIKDDKAVVNNFTDAAYFIYEDYEFEDIEGRVVGNDIKTPPTNSELLARINYCNNKDLSEYYTGPGSTDFLVTTCYPGFPETIVYKRINDTAFSLCGEIKTSITMRLLKIDLIIIFEYKFVDWDGETACFEFSYPSIVNPQLD